MSTGNFISIQRVSFTTMIIDLNSDFSVTAPHIPESVQETYGVSWDSNEVRLGTEPFMGFVASGPHTVSFTIKLHADALPNGDIVSVVSTLSSLYTQNIAEKPLLSLKWRLYVER